MLFFSSRRRHTRCALVTGVQTCALPIFGFVPAGSIVKIPTDHTWSDTANTEAANLRLAKEEAIGQPNVLAQSLDVTTFPAQRENKAAVAEAPEFLRLRARPDIFDAAAQTSKILAERDAMPRARPQAIVQKIGRAHV